MQYSDIIPFLAAAIILAAMAMLQFAPNPGRAPADSQANTPPSQSNERTNGLGVFTGSPDTVGVMEN